MIEKIDKIKDIDSFLIGLVNSIVTNEKPIIQDELNIGVSDNSFIWFDFIFERLEREFTFTLYSDGSMYIEELLDYSETNEKKVKEPSRLLYNPLKIYKYLKKFDINFDV